MKKSGYLFLFWAILVLSLMSFNSIAQRSCTNYTVKCNGSYYIEDLNTPGDYYMVRIRVIDDCPSTSDWTDYWQAPGINQSEPISSIPVTNVGIPDDSESYYYYRIWVEVGKFVGGTLVETESNFGYAAHSYSFPYHYLTVYQDDAPIKVKFRN